MTWLEAAGALIKKNAREGLAKTSETGLLLGRARGLLRQAA